MKTLESPTDEMILTEQGNSDVTIMLIDNRGMEQRWPEVEAALTSAFDGAQFAGDDNKGGGPKVPPRGMASDPVSLTRAGVEEKLRPGLSHVLAEDAEGRIIGGVFNVPTQRHSNERDASTGWIFTANDIAFRTRLKVLDRLVGTTVETLASVGYERVVVGMGTLAGARAITRRYGLIHEPTASQENRWVATLGSYRASPGGQQA